MIAGSHPLLRGDSSAVALLDTQGRAVRYGELAGRVADRQRELAGLTGQIVFLGMGLTVDAVVDYLALTGVGVCVALLDPAQPGDVLDRWIGAYQPVAWWGFNEAPDQAAQRAHPDTEPNVERMEQVLLTTSGSTGNPKFVRLSEANITSNATQIADALRLGPEERALAHLPLHYSFGLSILNSHLAAGGSLSLCPASVLDRSFAEQIREHQVTSVSGVPFTFEMARRAGLFDQDLPSLRHVTQAGGRLRPDLARLVHQKLSPQGIELWIMYGQTEATARIAVLPPEEADEGLGSVGYALPDGKLRIDQLDLSGDGSGEVIYEGPNVMLGYASGMGDINGADELNGVLRTGDLGRFDDAGRLMITGRSKRIAKVAGVRINLDDLERELDSFAPVAVLDCEAGVRVVLEGSEPPVTRRQLERLLGLAPGGLELVTVPSLPLNGNGKPDYAALREL